MKNSWKGHIAVLAANIIFGLNIPVAKGLTDKWMTPMDYTTIRSVTPFLIFWILHFFTPKEKVKGKDLILIGIAGVMGYIFTQALVGMSLEHTTPVYLTLISSLCPMIVLFLAAIFLREKIDGRKIGGVVLGVSGAIILISQASNSGGGGDNNHLWGITLAIISVITYSIYLILLRFFAQKYSPVTQMKWLFLFTSLILIPMNGRELWNDIATHSVSWGWMDYFFLAYIALITSTLALFLIPYGMKTLQATTVSIYVNLQPIVASIVALLVGQDTFSWYMPLSACMVLGGAYLVSIPAKKKTTETQPKATA